MCRNHTRSDFSGADALSPRTRGLCIQKQARGPFESPTDLYVSASQTNTHGCAASLGTPASGTSSHCSAPGDDSAIPAG